MDRVATIPVLVAYAYLCVALLLPQLMGARLTQAVRPVAIIGAVLHALALALTVWMAESPGLSHALSTVSLGVMVSYAWVGAGRQRMIGVLLAPLALVLLATALFVPDHSVNALRTTGYSAWLPIHLTLLFVGIAGFGLAFAVGVAYLWVRSRLKRKQLGGLGKLPSLEVLDRIQFRALLFGFVFLTLGIGAGGVWAALSLESSWEVDAKVWFTLLLWGWYLLALQMRLVAGRRGRWTALFSIVGFAGLLFSMIGVNFLMSGWHGYGS